MKFYYNKNVNLPIIKIGNNKINETSVTNFLCIHLDKKLNKNLPLSELGGWKHTSAFHKPPQTNRHRTLKYLGASGVCSSRAVYGMQRCASNHLVFVYISIFVFNFIHDRYGVGYNVRKFQVCTIKIEPLPCI